MMKSVTASTFKAQCLRLMEDVDRTRESVIITKRGRPVAKLAPVDDKPLDVFGGLVGRLEIAGDIVSPVTPLKDWESLP